MHPRTSFARDIAKMVAAVEIRSPTRFALNGMEQDISEVQTKSPEEPPIVTALGGVFYASFYCRPSAPDRRATDHAAARDLTAALSQANSGSGTWEPGWRMRGVDTDGRIAVHKDGLTVYATPGQFRPRGGAVEVGGAGLLRIGKELRGVSPGYYFAIGDGDQDDERDDRSPLVRIYWHLKSEGAVPFVAEVTRALNRRGVPFRT